MIKPQLQASIEQNVPKMPIARPFFVVFASRVLIYASILTKLGQNVDIHEVNNPYYYPFMIRPQLNTPEAKTTKK